MRQRLRWLILLFLLLLVGVAGCQAGNKASPDIQTTVQALVATQLAQATSDAGPDDVATIAAQSTQISVLRATATAAAPDDTTALRNALAAYLGWAPSDVNFSISVNDGAFASGGVRHADEMYGDAAWLAAKVEGVWVVADVGQDMPQCRRVDALNFPADLVGYCYCVENGETVKR